MMADHLEEALPYSSFGELPLQPFLAAVQVLVASHYFLVLLVSGTATYKSPLQSPFEPALKMTMPLTPLGASLAPSSLLRQASGEELLAAPPALAYLERLSLISLTTLALRDPPPEP